MIIDTNMYEVRFCIDLKDMRHFIKYTINEKRYSIVSVIPHKDYSFIIVYKKEKAE